MPFELKQYPYHVFIDIKMGELDTFLKWAKETFEAEYKVYQNTPTEYGFEYIVFFTNDKDYLICQLKHGNKMK